MKNIYIINSYLRIRKLYYLILLFAFVLIQKIKSQNLNLSSINGSYIIMKINQGNNLILANHQNIKWSLGSQYNNYNDPNEIYINGIKEDEIKNQYLFNETSNTVILIWNYPITDCHGMFYECKEITEIDLSHFDTSHVTNIMGIFCYCENLISLDLSNIDTSHITMMHSLFSRCYKLTSLDLSHFNTSQATFMSKMFFGSRELVSLDLSSFDTTLTTNIANMFNSCKKLIYINLKNADIKTSSLNSDKIFGGTPDNLLLCSKYERWNTFFNRYILNLNCFNNNFLFDQIKCYTKNLSITFNLCETCGKNYSQLYDNNSLYNNSEINCTKQISCYYSCKSCDKEGNITYHNCIECNDNYNYILNISNHFNCYNICEYYYYTDINSNKTYCTQNYTCPENYNKLIINKKECINYCSKDLKYIYEYNNICYDSYCHPDCQECFGSYSFNNTNCSICKSKNKYLYLGNCIDSCKRGSYYDNKTRQNICKCELDNCLSCSIESLQQKLCIECEEEYHPTFNPNIIFKNCSKLQKGYYLDSINNVYKKCYESAKFVNKKVII